MYIILWDFPGSLVPQLEESKVGSLSYAHNNETLAKKLGFHMYNLVAREILTKIRKLQALKKKNSPNIKK